MVVILLYLYQLIKIKKEYMDKVLIIEDDEAMLCGLIDNFEYENYNVISAANGELGLKKAIEEKPDLIILDIMLPIINGYEVCRLIREQKLDMPIIMLTAKGEESDIVLGLNIGADDYVTKPFGIRELIARSAAILRRKKGDEAEEFNFGDFKLNITSRKLTKSGKEIKLTPKEFNLLHMLVLKPGRVFSRDEIISKVWGDNCFVTTRSVDRCVTTIRNKIEKDKGDKFIHTVREVGYKFVN